MLEENVRDLVHLAERIIEQASKTAQATVVTLDHDLIYQLANLVKEIKKKEDLSPKETLKKMFDPSNMFGTGLNIDEISMLGWLHRFQGSLPQQPVEERRRRWKYIREMSAEYVRLLEAHGTRFPNDPPDQLPRAFFCSAHCEWAIEATWEGNWDRLQEAITYMSEDFMKTEILPENPARAKEYAGFFTKFREIAEATWATRPFAPLEEAAMKFTKKAH